MYTDIKTNEEHLEPFYLAVEPAEDLTGDPSFVGEAKRPGSGCFNPPLESSAPHESAEFIIADK